MIIDYRRCMSVGMIPVIVAEVNGGIVRIRHCSWLFLCLSVAVTYKLQLEQISYKLQLNRHIQYK